MSSHTESSSNPLIFSGGEPSEIVKQNVFHMQEAFPDVKSHTTISHQLLWWPKRSTQTVTLCQTVPGSFNGLVAFSDVEPTAVEQ